VWLYIGLFLFVYIFFFNFLSSSFRFELKKQKFKKNPFFIKKRIHKNFATNSNQATPQTILLRRKKIISKVWIWFWIGIRIVYAYDSILFVQFKNSIRFCVKSSRYIGNMQIWNHANSVAVLHKYKHTHTHILCHLNLYLFKFENLELLAFRLIILFNLYIQYKYLLV
jgi:hypothetical protein